MDASRLRIWGLIAAFVAVQVAVGAICIVIMSLPPANNSIRMMVLAIVFSQGSLLGTWVALGGKPVPWRWAGTTVILVGLMWLLEETSGRNAQEWAFFVFLQMLASSVPLWLARFLGLSLAMAADKAQPLGEYRSQFTLWSMLEWTAGTAVVLGMMQVVPDEFRLNLAHSPDTAIILALVGAEGALSFGILWLGLGARWTRVRLAALGLGVLALSAVFLAFPHGPPAHFFIVFLLSNIAWLVASLVVFRLCGFRLIWRRAVWL